MPSVEVSRRLLCTPEAAWDVVTDISLPLSESKELKSVEWIIGSSVVAGNRFRGHNENAVRGSWTTESVIEDVEPGARWTWRVLNESGGTMAVWGFEVEPTSDGCLVRQFARMGPDESGITQFIEMYPGREARIIEGRLKEWATSMDANLERVADLIEGDITTGE
jgi:hypothetical protein